MKNKDEMIQACAWLGQFVNFYEICEYSIVEYKPKLYKDGSPVNGKFEIESSFHPFLNGKDFNRSYASIDECLAGMIALKYDGLNTRADQYFLKSIS